MQTERKAMKSNVRRFRKERKGGRLEEELGTPQSAVDKRNGKEHEGYISGKLEEAEGQNILLFQQHIQKQKLLSLIQSNKKEIQITQGWKNCHLLKKNYSKNLQMR
ncbi:hypothetical protein SLEP1_g44317 [Rubroshorea leprosula]|uniref:Uncharacterized protein n=1 Tax=Rubroshorea leprosula TaxID=152421 RepID=A0AAV5LFT4_9ROSI|nr:hypothetical protein SLEP1_g44317 [Rubroshorea leprosula]